ncbi:MAG: PAS domain S-box protein [Stellaceae bacterium]
MVKRGRHREEAPGAKPAVARGVAALAIAALDGSADAFCAVDRDWRLVHVNRRAGELWGAAPETLIGEILWQRFPELAGSDAERRLRQAAAGGAAEYEVLSPLSGHWLAVRVCPIAGDVTGVYWRDVSDRKRAEEASSRGADHLRIAMEAAGFGIWDYDMLTGKRAWTDQARALLGVLPEVQPSFDAFIAAVLPEDRQRVVEAHRRSHDPAGGGGYAVEYRVVDPEGGERWIAARGRTLFDASLRPVRMIGVSLDVTEDKRREQALRDSRQRFQDMLEALPQIAFVIGNDGIAEYYNRHFVEYVGHAIGTDPAARTALQHPDDQSRLVKARMEGAFYDREYTVECRIRRHDGAYRWHVIRNLPLKRDGKTVAWLGTAVDIDDIREAQETLRRVNDELEQRVAERTRDLAAANQRLRASEESHRSLFHKAPVPMHSLDALRGIVDVNARWLDLFGYAREEVIGRKIADFYVPGNLALHDARWQELQRTGVLRDAERQFVKKSGEVFDGLVSAYLEQDARGEFLRTITVIIDITARKHAEEAVNRERQLSELLIESSSDGIIGIDNEMRYIAWNPRMETLSGMPRATVLGRRLFERRPDFIGTPVAAAWRAAMEGRRSSLRDLPHNYPPPGKSGFSDVNFAPLDAPDRGIIGAFAFLRDTTERRRIEEQLRQSQKMEAIGQLTGGVAHDFNNLLTVIMGNLDNLQHHLPDNAEAKRMAEAIMRAAGRAATLTHRLLAFARRQPLEPKPIDANKLVAGMSDLLRRSLGEGIVIETVLGGGLWRTLADPNQLENALLNLAVNARDAMAQGGKLTLETANAFLDESYAETNQDLAPGQYVLIAVSDTGSGMTREVAERAFEPFFTTKEVGQGTGLGLPQVFGFVKQSGGHVKIYSEPGEGTTVKLYLPRLADVEAPSDGAVEPRAAPAPVAGITILIVEDDDDVRSYGAGILRGLGYRVVEAPSGPEALRLLETEPEIRLLFTDVGLPGGLNGRQLADEAKRRRPDLKVLFTTGYARNAIVHQGRLDPGVELIVKPFTTAALGAKVRQVLQSG